MYIYGMSTKRSSGGSRISDDFGAKIYYLARFLLKCMKMNETGPGVPLPWIRQWTKYRKYVDPVRQRQSLSSSPEFRRKPPPIFFPAVADLKKPPPVAVSAVAFFPTAHLHIIYIFQQTMKIWVSHCRNKSWYWLPTKLR